MESSKPLDGTDVAGLRVVAREALDAFQSIATSANADFGRRGVGLGDLAFVNQATAEATERRMRSMNDHRFGDSQRLCREPAIARLVMADEDGNRETLYISSGGTPTGSTVRMCSYMSAKGQLAPLGVGDRREITLPGGRRQAYEVLDKLTFKPVELADGWDARPAVQFREERRPLTIQSLRELMREDGAEQGAIDALEAWLTQSDAAGASGNLSEGMKRDALTAMQLRIAPILNEFQDRIFRLPLDERIAVLGPPGTGKTTTLVRRLRQKIDLDYLDPENERPLVDQPDPAGLAHADSWIMFTPTELLRLYVKEAFGKEGVPVHDERMRTWDYHRREIGRGSLRILRTATSGGLVLRDDDAMLLPNALFDQIGWFEAFEAYQQNAFVQALSAEAERLAAAADNEVAALGQQVGESIARNGDRPLQLLAGLAARGDRLREAAGSRREETRMALREPLRAFSRERPGFLESLTRFVEILEDAQFDDADEDEAEGDEDEVADRGYRLRGARLAEDVFVKAMRSRAVAQASGRSPAGGSRAGRLLAWLRDQALTLPDLKRVGETLLVQRAALRLARAPSDSLARIPLRYRQFRRAMRDQGLWYGTAKTGALDAHPAEVDVIVLAMLRTALAMEGDRLLMQRLADRVPPMLREISRLRRDQVLVDEATDFSPVQLACMRALAHPRTNSFFLSGDFNQRLARWGCRSEDQLRWASPGLRIEKINVSYRQSRTLADLARTLGRLQGQHVDDRPPEHIDNVGWRPAIGRLLGTTDAEALWLSARIREIERLTDSVLPTIAILVPDGEALEPLADALSEALRDMNIRAVACPGGNVKGQAGDVRIFEVEHIKGLEFEAVFFMDIDGLHGRQPDLFDRYVYVGATRAATFLGLGCRSAILPGSLPEIEEQLLANW